MSSDHVRLENSHPGIPSRFPSAPPKWVIVSLLVGTIVGIVIAGLGAGHQFGAVGSPGFIGSLVGGGALTICTGSLLLACKKKRPPHQPSSADPEPVQSDPSRQARLKLLPEHQNYLRFLTDELRGGLVKYKDDMSAALKNIQTGYFREKSHTKAQLYFSHIMQAFYGSRVDFPLAGQCEIRDLRVAQPLDPEVFQLSVTKGVENDIPRSSRDRKNVHVYQVASQYNAAEAKAPFTPHVGEAMQRSNDDKTQGPLAQRTNPQAFECVTAFLANLGFNMLEDVLPSAGKTYQQGAPIEHGYLRPTNATIDLLTEEFKANFSRATYVCYSSVSQSWTISPQPVYIMLQAAPAIGYSPELQLSSDELQRYAALANYLALFRQGIAIARETHKPVILHATAVGGGLFGNTTKNLQWGFHQAALAFQDEMRNNRVRVQLEAYQGDGPLLEIATALQIPKSRRLGET